MKHRLYMWLTLWTLLIILSPSTGSRAAEDGVYELEYTILHASNDSVSIANDYFEKPAIWIVDGEEQYIQFTLNHSDWTKELQAPLGEEFVDVTVVDTDTEADTRTVQFKIEQDFTTPLEMKMHVYIDTLDPLYDHRYTVRFDFDESTIRPVADATQYSIASNDTKSAIVDSSMTILTWIGFILIIGIAAVSIAMKKKRKRIKEKEMDS